MAHAVPNPAMFPVPGRLEPGIRYLWVHTSLIPRYLKAFHKVEGEQHEVDGESYILMSKGTALRGFAPGNLATDLLVAIPDEWVDSPDTPPTTPDPEPTLPPLVVESPPSTIPDDFPDIPVRREAPEEQEEAT